MRPIVHGLAVFHKGGTLRDKYGAKIDFVYLDIDDPTTAEAKRKLGYRVQPDFYAKSFEEGLAQVMGP